MFERSKGETAKKYLVVGLGETGESVLRFLKKQNITCIPFDTRSQMGGLHDPTQVNWSEIEKVIVSPGVPLTELVVKEAKKHHLPLVGDIELFYEHAQAPIIAITGTNAKSTVTTLVTEMLNAAGVVAKMGGNIGIPALDLLQEAAPDFYVLELSSFQLELLSAFKALIATVLNISSDHLDRHGTINRYQAVKERIYQRCSYPIVNRALDLLEPDFSAEQICFSFGLDVPEDASAFGLRDHAGMLYLAQGDTLVMEVAHLSPGLAGQHNLENALSALAITAPLRLPLSPQLDVLRNFKSLPHRCVLVRKVNGVEWYNDSKGTNVGATLAAIKGIGPKSKAPLILILGGVAKDQDFSSLSPAISRYVREVIIFGQDRVAIHRDLKGIPRHVLEGSFSTILAQVKERSRPGETVLFSPACASYDMFKNFEDRGEQFTRIVLSF